MSNQRRSGLEDWEQSFESRPWWTTMRGAIGIVVIVLVCIALVGLVSTGSVFFQGAANKATIDAQVQRDTYTSDNAFAQYGFFPQQCERVRASYLQWQNAVETLQQDQKAARLETDPIRRAQALQALETDQEHVNGTANQISNAAADYNARAENVTANKFLAADLPPRIDVPASTQLKDWQPPTCG